MEATLEAKELRLGNFIIYSMGDIITLELDAIEYIFNNIEGYKPIPLTEEWHNKFGVKINGFNAFEYKLPNKNNIDISVVFNEDYIVLRQGDDKMDDDMIYIWNKDLKKRAIFVHEWQNLYFVLTGEELKKNMT